MKTDHKKNLPRIWRTEKFGNTSVTNKRINGIFKFNRVLHNQGVKSNSTASFARIKKDEILISEAEARRDQGRAYYNITPIR
jgi:hypothetical protein